MKLQEQITSFVEASLPDESLFVVEVRVVEKGKTKVGIFLDGDSGISIDQCAVVSRSVGQSIEDQELITGVYHLEVSSPGVDQPLRLLRQFPKHVGRKLALEMLSGEEITGVLTAVEGNHLLIDKEIQEKKKKIVVEACQVAFEEVKEAFVVIAF